MLHIHFGTGRLGLVAPFFRTEGSELFLLNRVSSGKNATGSTALDPQYADFVRDVDVHAYLEGAASSILRRFQANDDTITRILAQFRSPTPDQVDTVQSFVDRFLHRIDRR